MKRIAKKPLALSAETVRTLSAAALAEVCGAGVRTGEHNNTCTTCRCVLVSVGGC